MGAKWEIHQALLRRLTTAVVPHIGCRLRPNQPLWCRGPTGAGLNPAVVAVSVRAHITLPFCNRGTTVPWPGFGWQINKLSKAGHTACLPEGPTVTLRIPQRDNFARSVTEFCGPVARAQSNQASGVAHAQVTQQTHSAHTVDCESTVLCKRRWLLGQRRDAN